MREVTTKVYSFNELSEKAQEKVLDKFAYILVEHDWYEHIYEDAANIGLKITEFDTNKYIIKGNLITDIKQVIRAIKENHGEQCDTYILAHDCGIYINTEIENPAKNLTNEEKENEMEEITAEFEKDLLECYLSMLNKEYDYLTSKECLIEMIKSNEYEFTENGEIF